MTKHYCILVRKYCFKTVCHFRWLMCTFNRSCIFAVLRFPDTFDKVSFSSSLFRFSLFLQLTLSSKCQRLNMMERVMGVTTHLGKKITKMLLVKLGEFVNIFSSKNFCLQAFKTSRRKICQKSPTKTSDFGSFLLS